MFACACAFVFICVRVGVCEGRGGLLKSCLRRGLSVGNLWGAERMAGPLCVIVPS